MTKDPEALIGRVEPMPFVCRYADPRCEEDPCPWGVARFMCNAPDDDPIRARLRTDPAS